jgi:ribonuclease VapC
MTQRNRVFLFDASAILAYLYNEDGADFVEERLSAGVVSAANWSELAQKVMQNQCDWLQYKSILGALNVRVEPVTIVDAELAAGLWKAGNGLSLGDRLCLATAQRLNAIVVTADTAWGSSADINQIR